jgi:hypothetical protein
MAKNAIKIFYFHGLFLVFLNMLDITFYVKPA